jgi:5-methylthioadenosine/S-adenosylhomocysteine deaminase
MLEFVSMHHHPDGLTTVFAAPSTLFLCSDDFLVWAGEQSRLYNLGIQIHIAEIASEVEDIVKETGHTPVEHLEHLGLLNPQLSAVHCVHLHEHDIELLAKRGALAVHCPKSNMKLADGVAPVEAFQMATTQAARVARLDAGELQPGKLADVAVLDLRATHLQPFHDKDPLNMLVFCARADDVRDTIIHGKIVMRNRRLVQVNESDLLLEAAGMRAELALQ